MKKIILLTDNSHGGLWLAAAQHSKWLIEAGFDVRLFSGSPRLGDQSHSNSTNLFVPNSGFEIGKLVRGAIAFRSIWKSEGRPIVISHGLRSAFMVYLATFKRNSVVMHGFGTLSVGSFSNRLMKTLLYKSAPLWLEKRWNVSPNPGYGWSFTPWLSPNALSAELHRSEIELMKYGPLRITWLGRLEYPKKPEVLLRAILDYFRNHDLKVKFVGDGAKLNTLKEMLGEETAVQVEFSGWQDPVVTLQNSDVVVLLSDFEGIPFTIQESLAAGCALIVSPLEPIKWLCGESVLYAADEKEVILAIDSPTDPEKLKAQKLKSIERWEIVKPRFVLTKDELTKAIRDR